MTGTIIVAKGQSFDVRTIDFEQIADAFRVRANDLNVAKKILQSFDEFGMDMICADELSSTEFKNFFSLLTEIRADFAGRQGVLEFIDRLRQAAQTDERLYP